MRRQNTDPLNNNPSKCADLHMKFHVSNAWFVIKKKKKERKCFHNLLFHLQMQKLSPKHMDRPFKNEKELTNFKICTWVNFIFTNFFLRGTATWDYLVYKEHSNQLGPKFSKNYLVLGYFVRRACQIQWLSW